MFLIGRGQCLDVIGIVLNREPREGRGGIPLGCYLAFSSLSLVQHALADQGSLLQCSVPLVLVSYRTLFMFLGFLDLC